MPADPLPPEHRKKCVVKRGVIKLSQIKDRVVRDLATGTGVTYVYRMRAPVKAVVHLLGSGWSQNCTSKRMRS